MISIYQNKFIVSELKNLFTRNNEITVKMNRDIIQKDLDRLEELNRTSDKSNWYNKNNIKLLLDYVKKILKKLDSESQLELCWEMKDGLPKSYPIQLINEPDYGIDICNYIEVGSNYKLVNINTSDLADILAFDIMHRDLGDTQESMEKALSKCGITITEKADILIDYIKSEDLEPYKLARAGYQISDSSYMVYEKHKIKDYFGFREFNNIKYKDVVEYSAQAASGIIAKEINNRLGLKNVSVQIIAINSTNVVMLVNCTKLSQTDLRDIVADDICIRTFGRRFLLKPDVMIY